MDSKRLIDQLAEGRLSRRDFKKALGAMGLSLVTVPLMRRPARADDNNLTYFGWSGYDSDVFQKQYDSKHDTPPNFTFFGTEEEALQKMRQGYSPDVMNPCTYSLFRWHDAGLLAPLDESRLENLPDMFKSLNKIEGAIIDGQRFMMPMDWGNSTIVYRKDLLKPEDQGENLSWAIMYNDKYKGRTGFYDDGEAAIEIAALVAGIPLSDIFSLSDDQLEQIRPLLVQQRQNLRFYWDDETQAEQALASGELVASYAWNDAVVALKKQGLDVELGVPKEGIFTWCCGLVIHPDTPHLDEAYDLINSMTSAEAGAWEIQNWGYGHANQKAFDMVPADTLAQLGLSTPAALLESGIFFQAVAPEYSEKYNKLFTDVEAGA